MATPQPARGAPARMHAPNPATGYEQPAGPGATVIPIRGRSNKLVRGLIDKDGVPQDPYMDWLATVPNLMPGQVPKTYFDELVPNEEQVSHMIPRATTAHEHTEAHDDPSEDAFGRGGAESRKLLPLADLKG
jgi:hypothetical protein